MLGEEFFGFCNEDLLVDQFTMLFGVPIPHLFVGRTATSEAHCSLKDFVGQVIGRINKDQVLIVGMGNLRKPREQDARWPREYVHDHKKREKTSNAQ